MTSKDTPTAAEFANLASKLAEFGKGLPEAERELLGRLLSTSPLRGHLSDEDLGNVAGGTSSSWSRI